MQQSAPEPGWYPDPAGSSGVRWWDGYGWTEHLALPDDAMDQVEQGGGVVIPIGAPRVDRSARPDDGQLHPRARDEVFAGAPRGPIDSVDERMRLDARIVQGLLGAQMLGAASVIILCAWLVVTGLIGDGNGYVIGTAAFVGLAMPRLMQAVRLHDARRGFWLQWSASRGFEPGSCSGPGSIIPKGLDRSPLIGPLEQRIVEYASRRLLADRREAIAGALLRISPVEAAPDEQPPRTPPTPDLHRMTFVLMPLPEFVASRWAGASIRADHAATRPPMMRALLGPLVAEGGANAAHRAAAPGQDPHAVLRLGDGRLDQYLAEHPVDVDIVNGMLIVMRDGMPRECNDLDELCRTALLLHELVVADHELPRQAEQQSVAMPEEQPVVDLTRDGWGEGQGQAQAA